VTLTFDRWLDRFYGNLAVSVQVDVASSVYNFVEIRRSRVSE